MPKTEPKTINDLIKILAYNEWAWEGKDMAPHHKDRPTVTSLAEAPYAWTERQAKLAVLLIKRYRTKFESRGFEINDLLVNPTFDQPFRVINSAKTIEEDIDSNENEVLVVRFPYVKKIIELLRCLRDRKGLPEGYFSYDGETKTWTIRKTDVTTYYIVAIGIRFNFEFSSAQLLDQYVEIKKEKLKHKQVCAVLHDKIKLLNASDSLIQYWNQNLVDKKSLVQLDVCKNLGVHQKGINVKAYTDIGKKIAHNSNNMLWIDKASFTKDQIIAGLCELDCFPLIMPVSGEIIDSIEDTLDMQQWITCFERHGFTEKNLAFGFEFKEPKLWKDANKDEKWELKINNWKKRMDDQTWQIGYDLYQLSKSFKTLTSDTKIYFVRNRLTRSFMRANLNFKCSLTAIGGGFYHTGGEKIKRLLDNLPKKLYYSTSQPLSYQWKDRAIIKL